MVTYCCWCLCGVHYHPLLIAVGIKTSLTRVVHQTLPFQQESGYARWPCAYQASLFFSFLFRSYARNVGGGIIAVWTLLEVVGLGSIYFHSTLSFAGQLIDELAIAWVILAGFAIWTPSHLLARWPFYGNRCVCSLQTWTRTNSVCLVAISSHSQALVALMRP